MISRVMMITALVVSSVPAQRATIDISPVFARHGIHAVTGATPEGEAELTSRLGPEVMSSLADLRGHIALLRNDGPHSIQHAIWIWWGITPDGKRIPIGNETAVGAEGIKPADFYISAPSFLLSRALMHRAKQPRADSRALPAALQELEDTFGQRYTSVEATLDSVILNNGKIIGPDHYGLVDSRRGEDAARAEVLAKMMDISVSDAQLDAWLAQQSQVSMTLKANGLPDHSRANVGSTARMTRMMIQRDGRAKVAELYSQLHQKTATAKQLIQVKE